MFTSTLRSEAPKVAYFSSVCKYGFTGEPNNRFSGRGEEISAAQRAADTLQVGAAFRNISCAHCPRRNML